MMMSEYDSKSRGSAAAWLIAAIMAAAYIILGFIPSGWWGFNHLLFLPVTVRITAVVICAICLIPQVWAVIHRWGDHLATVPRYRWMMTAVVGGGILFVLLRISVHSMGDGYLRAIEIGRGEWFYPTEFLDHALHYVVYQALKGSLDIHPTTAMALISIAAGIVFVGVLPRMIPFRGMKKRLMIAVVFSLGGTQLFFGYAESYTLVYVFSVFYLLLSFRPAGTGRYFVSLSTLYLLAGLSHQVGMLLVLSYFTVVIMTFRTAQRRSAYYVLGAVVAVLPVVVITLLSRFIHHKAGLDFGSYFLPLIDDTYGILSGRHWFDIANLLLLTTPVGIILSPLLLRGKASGREIVIAIACMIPAVLFIVCFDPQLTMPRDWDLFAIPVTIAVIPLILIGIKARSDDDKNDLSRMTGAIAIACVFTAGWVAVNSYTPGHLERAEYYLERAERHQGWGYEVLGMYYHQQGDYDNEIRMLRSLPSEARTVRYYGKLATALWAQGTDVDFFRSVIEKEPNNVEAWCKLGVALVRCDSMERAEEAFRRAQLLDSADACVWYGWAEWWLAAGDTARADESCRTGIADDADDSSGIEIRRTLGL